MALSLTAPAAEHLFAILDDKLGFFSGPEGSATALAYREEKKGELLSKLQTEIPEMYWFQGVECHSLELLFDGRLFTIEAHNPPKHCKAYIEQANKKLHHADFEFAV